MGEIWWNDFECLLLGRAGEMTRVVPWSYPREWDRVFRGLYSVDWGWEGCVCSDDVLDAMGDVTAWGLRARVPVAIESTVDFIRVIAQDREGIGGAMVDSRTLCLLYSMTFIRFFNGVVDLCQKGMYAKSVSALSEALKLPEWFVDVRHESTHMAMPSLAVLRIGAVRALAWLRINYWEAQKSHVLGVYGECTDFMRKYRKIQKATLDPASACSAARQRRDQLLGMLGDVIAVDDVRNVLIPCLLEVGILIPTKESFRPRSEKGRCFREWCQISERSRLIWEPFLDSCHRMCSGFAASLLLVITKVICGCAILGTETGRIGAECGLKLGMLVNGEGESSERNSCLASLFAWGMYVGERYGLNGGDMNTKPCMEICKKSKNECIFAREMMALLKEWEGLNKKVEEEAWSLCAFGCDVNGEFPTLEPFPNAEIVRIKLHEGARGRCVGTEETLVKNAFSDTLLLHHTSVELATKTANDRTKKARTCTPAPVASRNLSFGMTSGKDGKDNDIELF